MARIKKTDWHMPKTLEHGVRLKKTMVALPPSVVKTLQDHRASTGETLSTQIRNIVLEKLNG